VLDVSANGRAASVPPGATAADALSDPGAVAARVNGRLTDLSEPLVDGAVVESIRFDSEDGREAALS
jgi:hypothetical protein